MHIPDKYNKKFKTSRKNSIPQSRIKRPRRLKVISEQNAVFIKCAQPSLCTCSCPVVNIITTI